MSITKILFGKLDDGVDIIAYTLTNKNGATVKIMNMGGIVMELKMPDRNGEFKDIVCGFDTVEGYLTGGGYQGALIGRYGNRIANGIFTLNGKEYTLAKNEKNVSHLHGGDVGFDKKIWEIQECDSEDISTLILTYSSPDGEEGYPGKLDVTVTYTLTNDNEFGIHYEAVTDKDTIINLTNHTYFNLNGYDSGDILAHELQISSDYITEVDADSITTGKIIAIAGTPFDFTSFKVIGNDINADNEQIKFGTGYDHNYILKNKGNIEKVAEVYEPTSGRVMEVLTNQPAIQLYTANMMNNSHPLKANIPQQPRHALCLETQCSPDTPNHSNFPSCVLNANAKYDYTTIYKFSTK